MWLIHSPSTKDDKINGFINQHWYGEINIVISFFCVGCSDTFNEGSEKIVYNGIPWFDDLGNIVNAHGACIVEDGGRYYLFGEYKSD